MRNGGPIPEVPSGVVTDPGGLEPGMGFPGTGGEPVGGVPG